MHRQSLLSHTERNVYQNFEFSTNSLVKTQEKVCEVGWNEGLLKINMGKQGNIIKWKFATERLAKIAAKHGHLRLMRILGKYSTVDIPVLRSAVLHGQVHSMIWIGNQWTEKKPYLGILTYDYIDIAVRNNYPLVLLLLIRWGATIAWHDVSTAVECKNLKILKLLRRLDQRGAVNLTKVKDLDLYYVFNVTSLRRAPLRRFLVKWLREKTE